MVNLLQVLSYQTFERLRSVAVHTVGIMSVDVAPGDRSAVIFQTCQPISCAKAIMLTEACAPCAGTCVLEVLTPALPLSRPKSWLQHDICSATGMFKTCPLAQMHSGSLSASGALQLFA